MDERRRDTIVGVFVLAALAIGMAMVFLVGSEQGVFRKRVQLRAIFGNVSGLRAGAPVFVAGLNVGTVQRLRFVAPREGEPPLTPIEGEPQLSTPVGEVEVLMLVEERYLSQIRRDSVATVASVGLLGDKSIEISVGTSAAEPVRAGDLLPSQEPFSLADLMDRVTPMAKKVDSILTDISAVTETLTGEGAPVERALGSLQSILRKVDEGKGTLGRLVNSPRLGDEVEQALDEIEGTVAEMRASLGEIKRALRDLPPTMSSARKAADDVARLSAALRQSAARFPEITDDVAVVTRNLRDASANFPTLAVEAEQGVRKARRVFDAAGRTIFLRGAMESAPPERLPTAFSRSPVRAPAASEPEAGAEPGEDLARD